MIKKFNEFVNEGKKVQPIDLPETNIEFMGKGRDMNGNVTVRLKFFNDKKAFSIQINSPSFKKTYRLLSGADYIDNLNEKELEEITIEIVDYIKKFGSPNQKSKLNVWGKLKESVNEEKLSKKELEYIKDEADSFTLKDGTKVYLTSFTGQDYDYSYFSHAVVFDEKGNSLRVADVMKKLDPKDKKEFSELVDRYNESKIDEA